LDINQQLLESERRLRSVLESVVDAIITIDERGTIESFNPAAERIFGFNADEVIGRNVNVLMPSPYQEAHDQYLDNYMTTGVAKIIGIGREVQGRRKDGSVFPMDLAVSVVNLQDRRIFTGIIRDTTELQETRARLVQSERLAAMGQMLSGIAHESRNALQRIQASVDMLGFEIDPESEAAGDVARIARAREDLQRLFEELRGFAAPIHLEKSVCDITTVWQQAWSHLEPSIRDRDASLVADTAGCDLVCRIDAFRVEQVFRNLMENSLAACTDPVRITIACGDAQWAGDSMLSIRVMDNGPGLTADQKKRVFDAFYTTKTKGTGLGMAIAFRIMEAHGGTLRVGSATGGGAEFELLFPRSDS
jgi:two-component system, LuxR family, sensor kinase FixL